MKSGKSRRIVYGLNLAVMVAAMLAVLGAVNWLGNKHYKRWDLARPTGEVLSDQTINLLKNLDKDVKVHHFYQYSPYQEDERSRENYRELLERYKSLSDHFDYEMIDYVKNPQRVELFFEKHKKISIEPNTSVVTSGDYVERVKDTTEAALTEAIIKVTRGKVRTVCFTTGHGEHDPDESGAGGYSNAREGLKSENFEIRKINILEEGVPPECTVTVIGGPVLPFKSKEAELLKKYLDGGGNLMAMLDATGETGLEELLGEYMIVPEDDVLKTEKSAAVGSDPFLILADNYNPSHVVTQSLSQVGMLVGDRIRTIPCYFYEVRSLSIKENIPEGFDAGKLISTSDNVRVFPGDRAPLADRYREFRAGGRQAGGEGASAPVGEVGPQVVAAYSLKVLEYEEGAATPEAGVKEKKPKRESRVIVFGDSDFAADGFIQQMPHGDVFLNSAAWLAEEEESIGIRPREKKFVPIHFAGGKNWFILLGVLVMVPLVVLINGVLVWRERKRL